MKIISLLETARYNLYQDRLPGDLNLKLKGYLYTLNDNLHSRKLETISAVIAHSPEPWHVRMART